MQVLMKRSSRFRTRATIIILSPVPLAGDREPIHFQSSCAGTIFIDGFASSFIEYEPERTRLKINVDRSISAETNQTSGKGKYMKTQAENLCLALCLGLMAAACISLLPSCASKRQSQSSDEYTDDKSLRLRVSTALSDNPDYKFDGVSVNVSKGVAELGGLVDVFSAKSESV